MEERVSQKAIFDKKLEDIVEKFDGFDELKKPLTYIKNGLGCWYTCMLYPGMESTLYEKTRSLTFGKTSTCN